MTPRRRGAAPPPLLLLLALAALLPRAAAATNASAMARVWGFDAAHAPHAARAAAAAADAAYLAACAAARDAPAALREWVDFHAALGVGKFYIVAADDPGAGALAAALDAHVAAGRVELFALPRASPATVPLLQVSLYAACLAAARGRHRFMAFIDVDEFLVPVDPALASLPALLRPLEAAGAGGVGVRWRTVGPAEGAGRAPRGARAGTGALAAFQRCAPWDWAGDEEVKTIVNVALTEEPTTDPHTFVYKRGARAVDPEGAPLAAPGRDPGVAARWAAGGRTPRLALYHYATRSEAEFRAKAARGSAMGNRRGWAYFEAVAAAATAPCGEAAAAAARLGVPGYGAAAAAA